MQSLQYHLEHRHATWLELFFDLVFVASIGVVTHNLAHTHHGHIELKQILMFPIEFLPIWWIWATHTLYANRFDTDSKAHRIASLIIMFLMVTMSAFLGDELFKHYGRFIGFYIAIRFVLAGLYLSSSEKLETSKHFTMKIGIAIIAGALISGLSIFFDSPYREYVLVGGLLFEMAATILIGKTVNVDPIHKEHLVERIGLFSIILLGESVISLVGGLRDISWTYYNIMAALTGFLMIGSIWWIYFDSFHIMERFKKMKQGYTLTYSHIFLAMGLVILANLIRHAILVDLDMHDFRILAITGLVFFYLGKQIPYYLYLPPYRINIIINSIVCIAITVASTFLPNPSYALVGMTLGMFFYTFSNLKWTLTKDASQFLEP